MKQNHKEHFNLITGLYADMDATWNETASKYGFKCTGCLENCCESEFYHHTYIEKNFLLSGFLLLPGSNINTALEKAQAECLKRETASKVGKTIRIMCPLNIEGLCSLYSYRPMICRLHGLPHELCRPGAAPVKSPGCKAGSRMFNRGDYHEFDRTPFYARMAALEMTYRNDFGLKGRLKQTIAEMLLDTYSSPSLS